MASVTTRAPVDASDAAESQPSLVPAAAAEPVRHIGLQGWALVALGLIASVAALRVANGFFVPLIASIVTALALAPVVRLLARGMNRALAAALVVCVLVAGTGAVAYSLADEAAVAIARLPTAARQLRQAVRTAINGTETPIFGHLRRAMQEIERAATESTSPPTTPAGVMPVQVVAPALDFGGVSGLGSGVLVVASQLVMMTFLVYFLLAWGESFKRKFVRLSGDRLSKRRVTLETIDQIVARMAKSISHMALTGLLVGVATWLVFWYFGVTYAALWGVAAGVLNAVPYFGPTVVGVAATAAALLQFGDLGRAVMVGGASLVITTLEGFLITPLLFGQLVRVNPVAVFVSALFWGWLWGVWGLLLALPLLVIIKTTAEAVEDLKPLAELLSD